MCVCVALFMHNMLIRPTDEELEDFGKPDFTVLNAGGFPANRYTSGMTSSTSVAINFRRKEMGKKDGVHGTRSPLPHTEPD